MAQSSTDGTISLVRGLDQIAAVEALRKEAYERSREFKVARKEAWAWTEADDKGYVLAAWDREGRPLATMRGIYSSNRKEAQDQLECLLTPLSHTAFPTLVLEKAATDSRLAQRGLNSVLRYVFLEAALQHKLGSMIGAVFQDAPRNKTLEKIGYRFWPVERMWDPNFNEYHPVQLVALSRIDMPMASLMLRKEFGSILERFPYRDSLIQLPIVQSGEASRDVES